MTPQQWRQAKQLFEQLINLERDEQQAYLEDHCPDLDVRREVESLIFHHNEDNHFLAEKNTVKSITVVEAPKARVPQVESNIGSVLREFSGTARFSIQKRLGAGGFGVVYQAYDRERNSIVALKTLHDADAGDLYRFKKEFRALADLVHPNLVALYELFSEQDQWFFTMEMIQGRSFMDYVRLPDAPLRSFSPVETATVSELASQPAQAAPKRQAPPLSGRRQCQADLPKLRMALKQVVTGLSALHKSGKIHRDIKPSNVLVTQEGRVVILDFGLVGDLSDEGEHTASSKNIFGTPAFMSPEQALGGTTTPATDWYSVGVMLYEALTGELPFKGSPMMILMEKQRKDARPPDQLVSGIPDNLNRLCQDLLQRDPKLRPTGREILRLLGSDTSLEARMAPPLISNQAKLTAPFVGREEELAVLNQAWQATQQGQGVAIYIKGPSGMGKSALVRHFLDGLEAQHDNLLILSGRCYEQESVPYKALDSIIDLLSRYLRNLPLLEVEAILPVDVQALARLFPVLRLVDAVANARRSGPEIQDSQELRRKAFRALRELLARLTNKKELILFIDDLQWGDLDSAVLLSELLRAPDAPRLLFIGSYRSEEARTSLFLKSLFALQATNDDKAETREIAVESLSAADAQQLALALLGEEVALNRAEVIVQESGGNPFFIGELAQYARTKNAQQFSDNGEMTIDKVVRARIAQLPEEARRLLEVVAVSGQPLARNVAKHAIEIDSDDQILPLLRAGHLLRATGSGNYEEIDTYHDRIREAVIAGLSAQAQKDYHHSLARSLELVKEIDAERLAKHFQLAGERNKACNYSITAAEQAAEALAFDRAAQLYQQTLALTPTDDGQFTTLKIKMGDALANAGKGLEAALAYLAATADSERHEVFELQRKATEHFFNVGHVNEGMELLEELMNKVGMKMARSQFSTILSFLLGRVKLSLRGIGYRERNESEIDPRLLQRIDVCWTALSTTGNFSAIQRASFQTDHILLALKAGDPYRLIRAFVFEMGFLANQGKRERVAKFAEMAMSLAKRINRPELIAMVNFMTGYAAFINGHWQRAWELFCIAEKITKEQCLGANQGFANRGIDNTISFSLRALYHLGDLNQIFQRLPTLLKEAREKGNLYVSANLTTSVLYLKHLAADEPDRAQQELSQVSHLFDQKEPNLRSFMKIVADGDVSLYAQAHHSALGEINRLWPILKKALLLNIKFVLIEALRLQARAALAKAVDGADAHSCLAVAERNARTILREQTTAGNGWAKLLLAGVESTRGRAEAALNYLTAAEQDFENASMALNAAAARRRRGQLLGGDTGSNLIAGADDWMRGQSIINPAKFTNMLVPGKFS